MKRYKKLLLVILVYVVTFCHVNVIQIQALSDYKPLFTSSRYRYRGKKNSRIFHNDVSYSQLERLEEVGASVTYRNYATSIGYENSITIKDEEVFYKVYNLCHDFKEEGYATTLICIGILSLLSFVPGLLVPAIILSSVVLVMSVNAVNVWIRVIDKMDMYMKKKHYSICVLISEKSRRIKVEEL